MGNIQKLQQLKQDIKNYNYKASLVLKELKDNGTTKKFKKLEDARMNWMNSHPEVVEICNLSYLLPTIVTIDEKAFKNDIQMLKLQKCLIDQSRK